MGEEGDDWDPRTCVDHYNEDYVGIITWGAGGDDANTWSEAIDCDAEELELE